MLELATYLLIGGLAGCQITETLHHGSLFKWLRGTARAWRESHTLIVSKAGELIECPFCLSHWACAASVLWLWLFPLGSMWQSPIVIFAAVRLSQLINDSTHEFTRSPPSDDDEPDEIIDETFVEPDDAV